MIRVDNTRRAEVVRRMRTEMVLTISQLLIGMVREGWITREEARAWRDRKGLPAAVIQLIDTLPPEMQFDAETRAMAFTQVLRLDPLVVMLAGATNKTPKQLDDFFITYANV